MSRKLDRDRVARYVEARRGVIGLTQRELAERANVDIKTINNLESGERWPQVKTRAAVERVLSWATGDLLRIAEGGEPTPTRAVTARTALGITATAGAASGVGVANDATAHAVSSDPILKLLDYARAGRSVEELAPMAGMTPDFWTRVIAGAQPALPSELARMAHVVGLQTFRLRNEAGRADVADALHEIEANEQHGHKSKDQIKAEIREIHEELREVLVKRGLNRDAQQWKVYDRFLEAVAEGISDFEQTKNNVP